MMPKLFLVPTPIGNLEDITLRALQVLKDVGLVLAEDTRTSSKLFKHFGISTHLESYHMHNEHKKVSAYVDVIKSGTAVALITDAGTPAISDPGFLLVRECLAEGLEVECLPGATAFVPALVNSGFPCERFVFEGFLPQKKGRAKRFEELKQEERTVVFYESPYRIIKTLEQLCDTFTDQHQVSVSRELTKLYEETIRGTLKDVIEHFQEKQPKGEFVIVFNPREPK